MGCSLWIYVQSLESAKTTKTFQIPLKVDLNNPELALVSVTDGDGRIKRTVNVTMKGLAEELSQLDPAKVQKGLSAWIDLSQGKPGELSYPVYVRWAPEYNRYEWDWDRRVNAVTEAIARITKPVSVITTGAPQAGVDYAASSVTPPTVDLVGPESQVTRVKTVRALLNLEQAESGVAQQVRIEMLDGAERPVEGVTSNPQTVEVRPALTPTMPYREVFVAARFSGAPAPGFRVANYTITPAVVDIQGPARALRLQGTIDAEPIDLSNMKASFDRVVTLTPPKGLRLKRSVRITVHVAIEADPNAPVQP